MWWSPIFTHRSEVSLSQQKLPLGTIFKGQLAIDPSCKLTQRRIHRNMGLSVSITSPLGLTSVFLCISLYFSVLLFFLCISQYFSVFLCISSAKMEKTGPTPLTSPLPLVEVSYRAGSSTLRSSYCLQIHKVKYTNPNWHAQFKLKGHQFKYDLKNHV